MDNFLITFTDENATDMLNSIAAIDSNRDIINTMFKHHPIDQKVKNALFLRALNFESNKLIEFLLMNGAQIDDDSFANKTVMKHCKNMQKYLTMTIEDMLKNDEYKPQSNKNVYTEDDLIVEFLTYKLLQKYTPKKEDIDLVAKYGRLDILSYWHSSCKYNLFNISKDLMSSLSYNGHLDALKYAASVGYPTERVAICANASKKDYLNIVKWYYEFHNTEKFSVQKDNDYSIVICAQNGSFECLKFICESSANHDSKEYKNYCIRGAGFANILEKSEKEEDKDKKENAKKCKEYLLRIVYPKRYEIIDLLIQHNRRDLVDIAESNLLNMNTNTEYEY